MTVWLDPFPAFLPPVSPNHLLLGSSSFPKTEFQKPGNGFIRDSFELLSCSLGFFFRLMPSCVFWISNVESYIFFNFYCAREMQNDAHNARISNNKNNPRIWYIPWIKAMRFPQCLIFFLNYSCNFGTRFFLFFLNTEINTHVMLWFQSFYINYFFSGTGVMWSFF